MENVNDLRIGRHCVFMLHAHLVFVTKYRRGVFTKEILEDLKGIFSDVCKDFEAHLEEFDGEDDHVHLLVTYPPKVAISHLVNSLKGVSRSSDPQKGLSFNPAETMGEIPVVAQLFRWQLRRRAAISFEAIH